MLPEKENTIQNSPNSKFQNVWLNEADISKWWRWNPVTLDFRVFYLQLFFYTFDSFTLCHSILLPDIQPHLSPPPFCTNEKIDCNRKTIYRGYNWSMRTLCLKERFFVYLLFPEIFSIVTLVSREQNLLMTGFIYLTITIFVQFFLPVTSMPKQYHECDIHNDIEPEST